MSKLDALLAIFRGVLGAGVELPKEISGNQVSPEVHIGLFTSQKTVNFNGPIITINASTKEGMQIAEKIAQQQQTLLNKGDRAVEAEIGQLIDDARDVAAGQAADDALLKSLRPIIPLRDVMIVSDALFIRRLHIAGGNVSQYKQLIVQKYGSRGSHICNLISAGYYETHLLPLHAQLVDTEGDRAQTIFNGIYEEAVTQYPFAVFVAARKEYGILKDEIRTKIAFNIANGQHVLNVHGIGKSNSKTIKQLLKDGDIARFYTAEPHTQELDGSVYARIFF